MVAADDNLPCLAPFINHAVSWHGYSLLCTAWCSKVEFLRLILICFHYYAKKIPAWRDWLIFFFLRLQDSAFFNKACVSLGTIFLSQAWQMKSGSRIGSNLAKSHINVNFTRWSLSSLPWHTVYTDTHKTVKYIPTDLHKHRQKDRRRVYPDCRAH